MRVLILGGDGYLGWPTAMKLSAAGHDVAVVDNYLRRNIAREEDVEPLYPVPKLDERARIWKDVSDREVEVHIGDLRTWEFTADVFREFSPDAVVHYAEQPAAPYSMLNRKAAMLTLQNNLETTANMIFATRQYCPDAQIVKLGTMGEYGTPNIDIEEGWIEIEHKGRKQNFLFPRQASSLYHTTKIMDTDLLWFYVRTWGLRVTDLMQGPVYGVFTNENEGHDDLLPAFSYDELMGTVLNRFVVQAAVGHPLTVYGSGHQIRGYLNVRDTLQCVQISLENPAAAGELRIFNQFTQTFSVNDLATLVRDAAATVGLDVEIRSLSNPRVENEDHYYNPACGGLSELGLEPHLLDGPTILELLELALRHKDGIRRDIIFRGVKWR